MSTDTENEALANIVKMVECLELIKVSVASLNSAILDLQAIAKLQQERIERLEARVRVTEGFAA